MSTVRMKVTLDPPPEPEERKVLIEMGMGDAKKLRYFLGKLSPLAVRDLLEKAGARALDVPGAEPRELFGVTSELYGKLRNVL